jgi:hypothetical protein
VRISTTFRNWYRQRRRQWHALRARLRHQRAGIALVVLLSLSLGEPLLCIIHCQLWIPFVYQSYFAAQRPHNHHTHTAYTGPTLVATSLSQAIDGSQVRAAAPAAGPIYFMHCTVQGASDTPFHVPPSPVHDVLPALMTVLAFVLVRRVRPAAAPGDPPNVPHPLRLRPPISFAV